MTSAEMIVSRDSIPDRDSEHGSEPELSMNEESPPSKNANKRMHDDSDKDEPETKSAREDLRQTRISDREKSKSPKLEHAILPSGNEESLQEDKEMEEPPAVKTPETPSPQDSDQEMKDRSSPKKKRPRGEDDEVDADVPTTTTNGEKSSNGSPSNGESILPLKKRHRDASQDANMSEGKKSIETKNPTTAIAPSSNFTDSELTEPPKKITSPMKETSASAFAQSGFASLASAPSPFATIGASKPSVFGGSATKNFSGFGTLTSQKDSIPTSGFGSLTSNQATGFGGGTTGGFGGLSGGFGGGFGGGFSTGFGAGPKLTSFAAPATKSETADTIAKPVAKKEKAFGAPESSEDEGSEDDDSDAEAGDEDEDHPPTEEKKKSKAPKAPILDGEEDEITLCQFRAKLFVMSDKGWKERGVGAIKINIPRSHGAKILFGDDDEEAGLITREIREDENGKPQVKEIQAKTKASYTARLIMRQESTHRVILNSIILKDQVFQEKSTNTAVGIVFTAFEDGKPTNMQFKMNPSNASEFLREIEDVKHRL